MRLLAHVHVLAEHVLHFHDENHWCVLHRRRADVFPRNIKIIQVMLPLVIKGVLVRVAKAQKRLQHLLPETSPNLLQIVAIFGNEGAPCEPFWGKAVVAKGVAVAFADLQSLELWPVAVLHTERRTPGLRGSFVCPPEVTRLLKDPGGAVGVDVLSRPGQFCLHVVCRQLGKHAHEALRCGTLPLSACSFTYPLGLHLEHGVDRVHCRKQQGYVEGIDGVLKICVWLEALWHREVLVLTRPSRRHL
mmetsp:Transcript_39190/g.109021  ORF Transcript_39190/g.109021 Transcript_39190/m.109021 type:complete len:246 (-) Transcript_39190:495-1232(-)